MSISNPYSVSKHYRHNDVWADEFARGSGTMWHVFKGDMLLARVETRQQAFNILSAMGVTLDNVTAEEQPQNER